MTFKDGDKVVCIGMYEGYNDKLTIGSVYTILSVGKDWCYIKDHLDYDIKYFIPYTLEYQYPFETIENRIV